VSSGGAGGDTGRPVQPSRAERSGATHRRRRAEAILAVVLVAAGLLFAATQVRGARSTATPTPSTSPTPRGSPSSLLAFSVTGGPNALLAVVGSGGGRAPGALVLPPGMTVVVPGQGDATTEEVQALPGESMRVAVSNTIGAWTDHYAVTDLRHLGRIVDRMGGLTVDITDVFTVGNDVLGPGPTHLSGDQVVAFLRQKVDDTATRWASVLDAFLAASPDVQPGDLTEADDATGAAALLGTAAGSAAKVAPTQDVGGTAVIAQQPDMDQLVGQLFGTPAPVRSLVQNGNGAPGIGEAVATLILPEGFRVVLSQNADSFDHATTEIVAIGKQHLTDAMEIQKALGVGKVEVTQVPSGLADVTILVGKDFKG